MKPENSIAQLKAHSSKTLTRVKETSKKKVSKRL